MREMKLKELKQKSPTELLAFAEENDVENASTMRKQELMFAILKQLASVDVADHRRGRGRNPAGRICFPALGRRQLSSRSRRHLRLAVADPAAGVANRRHGRGRDPQPQGRRTLFRAAQMQRDQFRGPGKDPAQGPLRQPDAALSRRTVAARGRRSDPQGHVGAGHRHRRADRQGAAGAHRRAAAHRQDGAAAEHRPVGHRQSPGMLFDRPSDRRAPGRSDGHAAVGEGRGGVVDLRRARGPPRSGRRDGDREGQEAGRARTGCGHPARFDHAARTRLQHRRSVVRQGSDRRRRRQRACSGRSDSSARRGTSKRAAR